MRNVAAVLALAVVVCLAVGCPNPEEQESSPTVYTAGYYAVAGYPNPCYWVGTTRHELPLPTGAVSARATSIFVDGGAASAAVVYASGFSSKGGKNVPCYWDATTWHDLETIGTGNDGYAQSIVVSGGTVYIAGYCHDGSKHVPCYWTGTTKKDLPTPGSVEGYARSLVVFSGVVHVAGSYSGSPNTACYWTDDGTTVSREDLPVPAESDPADGYGICMYEGAVYVAGRSGGIGTNPQACYWIADGIHRPTQVPLGGYGDADTWWAEGISVQTGIVYTAGGAETSLGSTAAGLWIDTTWAGLTAPDDDEINAYAIDVAQGVPYVAGSWWDSVEDNYIPCYWSGTPATGIIRHDLPDSDPASEALAIFLVETQP